MAQFKKKNIFGHRKENAMDTVYKKKTIGTSLFVTLVAAALLTTIAFAQAAASDQGQNSGQGKKLGHVYGVGNGGTPPAP